MKPMEEVLHANIFFFIASVGVVLFIVLTCFILFYVLQIVRAVRKVVDRIERESETVVDDIHELRRTVSAVSPTRIVSFLMKFAGMSSSRSRRRRTDDEEEL